MTAKKKKQYRQKLIKLLSDVREYVKSAKIIGVPPVEAISVLARVPPEEASLMKFIHGIHTMEPRAKDGIHSIKPNYPYHMLSTRYDKELIDKYRVELNLTIDMSNR